MNSQVRNYNCSDYATEEDADVRKGPWTVEEDSILADYINIHGEGRWNTVARSTGLKRTGKSCRLRWLNYLRPDVRRGNITLQEQLMILELHSRWGNRWSKIAQYLPGRTDNEIKNYWRTRVQKLAKQLKCDVNSRQFRDTMRHVWIPRLIERIQTKTESFPDQPSTTSGYQTDSPANQAVSHMNTSGSGWTMEPMLLPTEISTGTSSDSMDTQVSPVSDLTDPQNLSGGHYSAGNFGPEIEDSGSWDWYKPQGDMQAALMEQQSNSTINGNLLLGGEDLVETLWNDDYDSLWFLQQHQEQLIM